MIYKLKPLRFGEAWLPGKYTLVRNNVATRGKIIKERTNVVGILQGACPEWL